MNIGRNSPCPCGSGKKFKKCCGGGSIPSIPVRTPSPEAIAQYRKHIEQFEAERQRYGNVNSVISANFKGHKFVAVGNTLHWSKDWKTFPDFLFDYIKMVLGRDWGRAELKKPESDRHQIVKWHIHVCNYQKVQQRGPDGLYAMVPDGITSAYMLLAYDLYVLRHHQNLQDAVIRRLKDAGQFQGARYELFVAATLIRAGCQLAFEDETDPTVKHPELVATHGRTGTVVDVEAKSRHRSGVLGQPGDPQEPSELKMGLHRLVNRGSEKARTRPIVIFVDLNLPPDEPSPKNAEFLNDIRTEVNRIAVERKGVWPFSLLIATNCPHHYGQFNQPDPIRLSYIAEPDLSDWPHQHEFANDLELALRQYGNIPDFFLDDFDRDEVPQANPPPTC